MKEKGCLKLLIVPLVIPVVLIVFFFILPWFCMYLDLLTLPNPPKPEITYGEFPFRLEYEINGERVVIYDTLICEYDGVGANIGYGKYRKWKSRLASGAQDIILLEVENPVNRWSRDSNILTQTIYYAPGSAAYYMGDISENLTYQHSFPNASFFEQYDNGGTISGVVRADELYETFNIKLISWEPSEPITNSFKPKWPQG